MKNTLFTLKGIIILSSIGFLSGIARLIIDVRFVSEVSNVMLAEQPIQTGAVILAFVLIFAVWLWALLLAALNNRTGLIALMLSNLILMFLWGFSTLVTLCPTPCSIAYPLTDIVTWANVIIGLVVTIAIWKYLYSNPELIKSKQP